MSSRASSLAVLVAAASPADSEEVSGRGQPDRAEEGEDGDAEDGEEAGKPPTGPHDQDLERDRGEQDAAEDGVRAALPESVVGDTGGRDQGGEDDDRVAARPVGPRRGRRP